MHDDPRVLALRLALIAAGADNTDRSNETVNEALAEIGHHDRGALTQTLLSAADLLAEELGAERIASALAAELDAATP